MKSLLKITIISGFSILFLSGFADKPATNSSADAINNVTTNNNTTNNKISITTDEQKESYALGASFANYLQQNLKDNDVTLDQEYIINGFNDTLRGVSQQTEQEVRTILDAFSKRIRDEAAAKTAKEIAENTAAGDKFREEFAKQDGVKKSASGLLYKIEKSGTEPHPTLDSTVTVHYTGTLIDGRKFESSYDNNEPAIFPLNGVIKGWSEGIQLIGTGGKIKLVMPPNLAYGDQRMPENNAGVAITPASTLVFEIELLDAKNPQEESTPNK